MRSVLLLTLDGQDMYATIACTRAAELPPGGLAKGAEALTAMKETFERSTPAWHTQGWKAFLAATQKHVKPELIDPLGEVVPRRRAHAIVGLPGH